MKQGEKITIIWDEHEPPKNYIWVHGGKAYEHNGQEWVESEYDVAKLQYGHSNKREMISEDNTTPPDNMIWNKEGDILVNKGADNWKDILGEKIFSWLIVDHTNFAEARHNELEDYYNNYPVEARQDGETWPPFTVSAFPWFVVNYSFDGIKKLHVYYKGEEKIAYCPSAKVEREDGQIVDRTYAIIGIPADFAGLDEYTETVEGNPKKLNPEDFKVYLTEE